MEQDKDLCKTCKYHWVDFPLPLDHAESHCEILDNKIGTNKMDEVVPYPCTSCPFNSYFDILNKQ